MSIGRRRRLFKELTINAIFSYILGLDYKFILEMLVEVLDIIS